MLATVLASSVALGSFDLWGHKSMWYSIYNGQKEHAIECIEKRSNLMMDDQMMNIFMKAYLEYRIEVKTKKDASESIRKIFQEADQQVNYYLWLD